MIQNNGLPSSELSGSQIPIEILSVIIDFARRSYSLYDDQLMASIRAIVASTSTICKDLKLDLPALLASQAVVMLPRYSRDSRMQPLVYDRYIFFTSRTHQRLRMFDRQIMISEGGWLPAGDEVVFRTNCYVTFRVDRVAHCTFYFSSEKVLLHVQVPRSEDYLAGQPCDNSFVNFASRFLELAFPLNEGDPALDPRAMSFLL